MADATMAIRFALSQLGKPYLWGATGPDSYDCSGLMVKAYNQIGITLPRTTQDMVADSNLLDVNVNQLQPGDLIFPSDEHVQMYLGGGKVVEAPRTGLNVRVTGLGKVWKAKRVVQPSGIDFSGTPVSSSFPAGATQADLGDLGNNLLGTFGIGESDMAQIVGTGLTDAAKTILKPVLTFVKIGFMLIGGIALMVGAGFLVYQKYQSKIIGGI